MHEEIDRCRGEVEYKILQLESEIKQDMTSVKKDIQSIQKSIEKLVERNEFMPVKLIAFGLAGGVLMTVLGIVLSKVLG
jgi:wobble nucleotide-excising tRNase